MNLLCQFYALNEQISGLKKKFAEDEAAAIAEAAAIEDIDDEE
jgi:hypothetical protein